MSTKRTNKKMLAARVLCTLLLGTYLTGGYQPPVRAAALNVYGNTNITVDSGRFASAWGCGSDDYYVTATGQAATAFGWGTKAEGDIATSFGQITAAYGGASTAFGWNSKAYGTASTAFGNSSETYGYGTTAFGSSSQAFGDFSTAFGEYTNAFGEDSTAFGYKTQAGRLLYGTTEALIRRYKEGDEYKYKIVDANTSETLKDGFATYKDAYGDSSLTRKGDYATAWGNNTKASGDASTAFGWSTEASGKFSTAFGGETKAIGQEATTFGYATTAEGVASTAFGALTKAIGDESTAFGEKTTASGNASTAFGIETVASGEGATAWGEYSVASGVGATAWGLGTKDNHIVAGGESATAFGKNSLAYGDNSLAALGGTTGEGSIAIIPTTGQVVVNRVSGKGDGAVAIGEGAVAENSYTYAVGKNAKAQADDAISLGNDTSVTGAGSLAIGKGSSVSGANSIAIGTGLKVSGKNSGAFGDPTIVSGDNSYSVGNNNEVTGSNTFVFGNNVKTGAKNAVVLGDGSEGVDNAVSVGAKGKERQIKNVADGTDDTDAATVGQLKALAGGTGAGLEEVTRRISDVDSKVNKVGAGAAALAALHPMDTDGKFSMAAGFGNYRDANAMALGLFYRPNDQVMFSMGGSLGNGENMINAGVSFALDKGVSTSKAAMARTIKAQGEKISEQDAKIQTLEAENAKLAERLAAIEAKLGK